MSRSAAFTMLVLALPAGAQVVVSTPTTPLLPMTINHDLSLATTYVQDMSYALSTVNNLRYTSGFGESFGIDGPRFTQDPADSLYRAAREQLNRGDYRRAVAMFKDVQQKYPNTAYLPDVMYWHAFALYRMDGTSNLMEALRILEARKPRPSETTAKAKEDARKAAASGSTRTTTSVTTSVDRGVSVVTSPMSYSYSFGNQVDASALAARIANVLSKNGQGDDPMVKRALAANPNSCDQDEQAVRAEALSALMQTDPEGSRTLAARILARKDECSVPLRRNAVLMIGNKRDEAAAVTLAAVAKNDPSTTIRSEAVNWLARLPGDAAFNALSDIAKSSDNPQIQRTAARALASSENPKARIESRTLVEQASLPIELRLSVLDGFSRDQTTAEDAAWLRGVYGRATEPRVKQRIVSIVSRVGGDANDQWLASLIRNEDEPLDIRASALRDAGRTMDVAALAKLYDAATTRPIRSSIIDQLSNRTEPQAVDKLIDIAKNSTDVNLRKSAISALARSKDPRASKMLLELIDR